MLLPSLLALTALLPLGSACPQHQNNKLSPLRKRTADPSVSNNSSPEWAYEASYNWHTIHPSYSLCQNGTQQSPIALSLSNGLSLNHAPTFNYSSPVSGNFYNWGYGPAFTVAHDGDWTTHPSISYDNETLYLKGWHIHAPADHSVGGDRSKAELHLVHVDSSGDERAVLALRLDPGNVDSAFFTQLPSFIPFTELDVQEPIEMDLTPAMEDVKWFNEFWTYQGSLTSPPCTEGIRWFVARQILFVGVGQMQGVLGVSAYSARAEQEVWLHRINE
ncbi:carbonic anhydrase [Trematosphaeria pertusa]|uniref:Carbonic anhydrase n=1 Tax=Trematosphaeria pertusa TaxID=390896 RepID=A0A6A6ICH8_9PLEO|nr:carbonic anhydrase [Trematosphaeria pertusa]KAF2247193.1 carbonic anhydrase [Trematosphaeria pertusa]